MKNKPVIIFDISSSKKGGPYIACKNIIDSQLNKSFEFKEITYDIGLGRFISWRRIKDLKRQIKAINPDGIVITGLQLSCFHVCVAALLSGVRTRIITIHGSSTEALGLSKFKKKLLYFIEFFSLWMCTSFYGVSKYASTISATKWFRKKNRGYVYNLPTKELRIKNGLTREQLGLKSSDIVISSSGRITREKGYAVLTEAIKRINDPNIKFIIVGDGEYLGQMQKELSHEIADKRVVLTGFTNNVYEYIRLSDIFVLPTLHETLSVSLLEASAASLPLISCNVGGVAEVIENGYNGLLVSPNDAAQLSDAIETLARNTEQRKIYGHNSLKRLHAVFSTEKSLEKLKNLINTDLSRWEKE